MSYLQLSVMVYKMTPGSKYQAVVEVLDVDKPTSYEGLLHQVGLPLDVPRSADESEIAAWTVHVLENVLSAYKYRSTVVKPVKVVESAGQMTLFDLPPEARKLRLRRLQSAQ